MAQINEKPRKRQFLLELDEDEIAELITWAENPSDDFVRGDVGDALLRTLRRALGGPLRSHESDNAGDAPKRSRTASGFSTETNLDRKSLRKQELELDERPPMGDFQESGVLDVGEGMQWRERD